MATDLFDRLTTPQSGFGNNVSYDVDDLRGACLRELATRGPDGVEALRGLAAGRPLAQMLGSDTLRVLVDDWWEPLTLDQFIRILADSRADVVRSGDELLRVVRRAIESYEQSLHGIGGGAELLWSGGRPRPETELSIDLMRYLRLFMARSNVILNREVELRPASTDESIRGERSDILIEASHPDRPTISLVIEIKGSWNAEKYSGYQKQLTDRYLAHPDVAAGLHLVYWFDKESWDTADARRRRSPKLKAQVLRQLESLAPQSSKPVGHAVVNGSR